MARIAAEVADALEFAHHAKDSEGRPLKLVAGEVGYASQPGFLRAFRLVVGMSPKQWLRSSADGGMAPPD